MYDMIISVLWMTHTCHTYHLIVFLTLPFSKIAVTDKRILCKCCSYVIGIYELKEFLPVSFINSVFGVPFETVMVIKMYTFLALLGIAGIFPVANGIVLIEIDMINASVIRSHGCYHPVLIFTTFLLFYKLIRKSNLLFHLFLFSSVVFYKIDKDDT